MILKTADGEEKAEQIRLKLAESPEGLIAECADLTDRAIMQADAVQQALREAFRGCETELRIWQEELRAMIAKLPLPRSVFRVRASERELAELCRRTVRLERCGHAMGTACQRFSEVLRLIAEADAFLCRVFALTGRAVCEAAGMEAETRLRDLNVRLDAAGKDLKTCVRACREARDAWSGFCMEEIPAFLKTVRQTADFAGEGENCDLAALHRILGGMRHRSERVF